MSPRRSVPAVLVALALTGCFRTVVRSGHPPAEAPESYDERWHSGYVAGLIEASGPHPVDAVCPEGSADVRTATDPLPTRLNIITWTIYSPQAVTVVCAEKGAPPAPPHDGYEVPPIPTSSAVPLRSGYPPPAPSPKF